VTGMVRLSWHASHEQFPPSSLLAWARRAEAAGFDGLMSSDHFHPWSERQGQSGFAWSWLGAAMEATRLPCGIITAPGWRYHPAVVAQGAATLAEMYPDRLWLALGSGEAINEAVTGLPWPDKPERTARLEESAEAIRALLAGETVTRRGRITVVEAKLYTRPARPPRLLGAAVSEATARRVGRWADGLITVATSADGLRPVRDAFARGGGAGRPLVVQVAHSWAPTEAEAEAEALHQWGPNAIGGDVNWELRRPADFDLATRFVRGEDVRGSVVVSADLGVHAERLAAMAAEGAEEIVLHGVGRDQERFIDVFGREVLPRVRAASR
jgi:coenzyme F420-dependent glucose-6-phosphate dehydrogenase